MLPCKRCNAKGAFFGPPCSYINGMGSLLDAVCRPRYFGFCAQYDTRSSHRVPYFQGFFRVFGYDATFACVVAINLMHFGFFPNVSLSCSVLMFGFSCGVCLYGASMELRGARDLLRMDVMAL